RRPHVGAGGSRELNREGIPGASAGERITAEVDRVLEATDHEDVAGRVHVDAERGNAIRASQVVGPEECATRGVLDHESVRGIAAKRPTAEVHGAGEIAGDGGIAISVDGYAVDSIIAGASDGADPQVRALARVPRDKDVREAGAGDGAAPEVG